MTYRCCYNSNKSIVSFVVKKATNGQVMNTKNSIALLAASLVLSACSSGGGDSTSVASTSAATTPTTNTEVVAIAGGAASSPVELNLTRKHEIKTNPSNNYFSYTAQAGEKLVIQSVLNTALSSNDRSVCAIADANDRAAGNTGYISGSVKNDILIYDLNLSALVGSCTGNMTYTFTADGTYIIYADFSRNSNSGFFNASSLSSNISSGVGSPNSPAALSLNSSNQINVNPFFNYFSYTAQAGEKLVMQSVLSTPLTSNDISACSIANAGGDSTSYTSGAVKNDIIVYDLNLNAIAGNCSGSLTYTFTADGTYIIYADFSRNSNSGSFSASSLI